VQSNRSAISWKTGSAAYQALRRGTPLDSHNDVLVQFSALPTTEAHSGGNQ
jgi:hypothetical protein